VPSAPWGRGGQGDRIGLDEGGVVVGTTHNWITGGVLVRKLALTLSIRTYRARRCYATPARTHVGTTGQHDHCRYSTMGPGVPTWVWLCVRITPPALYVLIDSVSASFLTNTPPVIRLGGFNPQTPPSSSPIRSPTARPTDADGTVDELGRFSTGTTCGQVTTSRLANQYT